MSDANNRKRAAADRSSGSSKKSKAVALMVEDLEELNCPICFELPKAEVYQCSDGHSVCSKCIVKFKNCPTCAVPYPGGDGQGIRNRFAEQILSTVRFNCSWKEEGCDRQGLTGQQLTEHEEQCSFNPKPIKLCALLFWSSACSYQVPREFLRNPSLDLPDGWEDHMQAQHYQVPPIEDAVRSGSVSAQNYSSADVETWFRKDSYYFRSSLFRLVDNRSGDTVGLFMVWVWNHCKKLSWFVVRVTDQPKFCSIRVKFTLKGRTTSEDGSVFKLETTWDAPIIGLHEFRKSRNAEAEKRDKIKFYIPEAHLRQQYLNAEGGLDLQYVFTVAPHGNSTPGDSLNSSDDDH